MFGLALREECLVYLWDGFWGSLFSFYRVERYWMLEGVVEGRLFGMVR